MLQQLSEELSDEILGTSPEDADIGTLKVGFQIATRLFGL